MIDLSYNLHPPLSAFPFALLGCVAVLEFLNFFRKSEFLAAMIRALLLISAVAVLLAFLSGYQGQTLAEQSFKVPHDHIETHHSLGRLLLFVIVPCTGLAFLKSRATHAKRFITILYLLSFLACLALVVVTGKLGADLVFLHGAGVNLSSQP